MVSRDFPDSWASRISLVDILNTRPSLADISCVGVSQSQVECSVSESEITTCPSYLVWALGTLSANLDNECCPFCESLKIGDLASFNPNWGSIYFASLKVSVKWVLIFPLLCVLGDRLRVGWAIQQRAAHLVTTLTILSVTNITCHVRESFQWLSLPSFGII